MIEGRSLEQQVQWLADRAEISDVLFRYFSSTDLRDWNRWGDCLTEDVEIDLGFGQRTGREDVIRWVEAALVDVDATHHMSSNHEITIDGDTATVRSDLLTTHVVVHEGIEERLTAGGIYNHVLVRTAKGWKIRKAQNSMTWRDGNPTGPAAATHARVSNSEPSEDLL